MRNRKSKIKKTPIALLIPPQGWRTALLCGGFCLYFLICATRQAQAATPPPVASTAGGGSLPATLGWYQIPNTVMTDICPSGFACQNVIIGDWSGGTADAARNRLLVWGGGHGGYAGNEIYALNLSNLKFERLNNPSPTASSCVDTLSDGNPNSRHTYAGLSYIPGTDQMVGTGGSLACSNGTEANDLWTLSLSNLQWTKICGSGNSCGYNNGLNGKISAYDPNTQDVLINDRDFLYRYNPTTKALARGPSMSNTLHTNGEIDPARKRWYVVGDGTIYYVNIDPNSASYGTGTNVAVGGCSSPAAGYPGMAYDPDRDKIVMWAGGSTVYEINTAATPPTCTANNSFSGGPGAAESTGTHGRFRYFPLLRIFALVNDPTQNAWALRLTSGGTPPPPSPCDVNGDGITNVADVQLEVNMALGINPCTNPSGTCTVVSVQRVVNAALGGTCVNP